MYVVSTPQNLMDFLRKRTKSLQEHFRTGRHTDADIAFHEQLYQAIHRDPMAVAYAAYLLEYAHRMLPYLMSFHTQIKRELPPTKAQEAEFNALGISGILGYNRSTAPQKITQVKAEHARQLAEWKREKARR